MFEGLVRQLILGYLGRYIKDIHKEQLKITLWHEEVLLENVELILEAFDYLQLPFALKEGRVGRLSIKIPWKKLGWDPIIILLEDVLVCACQRHDVEWNTEAVEKREFAGKKAKLAAAELAKLSRRVCDNESGKSFISFITAKILDGIQVSMRNVHVLYRDMLTDSAHAEFGLKFSSLTVMKQNLSGNSSGKVKGNQVTKFVEIQGLAVYCSTHQETLDEVKFDNDGISKLADNAKQGNNIYMLAPVDVSMSLLVNKPGKVEKDAAQYSMNIELTGLLVSLDEVQLQQILALYDYLSICRLRERYGRYRPWGSPLSKRLTGWQMAWWHYAQQSVLADVRKKLRSTSWKYLGERLTRRCKYVKLYKTKLECLQQEQFLDDDILWELEQIEKEAEIDDILSYRSVAEHEIEEVLEKSTSEVGVNVSSITSDKLVDDEHQSSKPRGWLNWLSRGMLGAGGTDDSSQFSGVVSNEVIKDIYEATKFHSVSSSTGEITEDEVLLSSIKLNIGQISATLRNMKFDCVIADMLFEGLLIECKIWKESAMIISTVHSAKIVNPSDQKVILLTTRNHLLSRLASEMVGNRGISSEVSFTKIGVSSECPKSLQAISEKIHSELNQTSVFIQVDILPVNHESELSIKVVLNSVEVTVDKVFFLNIIKYYEVLQSFTFQEERVLLSLNNIDDDKVRLLSKAEFILSSRKSVVWDVQFFNTQISIPWEIEESDPYKLVLGTQHLSFGSKRDIGSFASDRNVQQYLVMSSVKSFHTSDMRIGFQLKDLYDHFEIDLDDFKVELLSPFYPHALSIVEELGASVTFSSCIVPDESILNRFEACIIVSSFLAHFSYSVHGAIMGLVSHFNTINLAAQSESLTAASSLKQQYRGSRTSNAFHFSVVMNLESASLFVDLENETENSRILLFYLTDLNIRLSMAELRDWWICTKALKIVTYPKENKDESHTLCSSEFVSAERSVEPHDLSDKFSQQTSNFDEEITHAGKCFLLHYQSNRNSDLIRHKYSIWLNDYDLHCYPDIIALLIEFIDKLDQSGAPHVVKDGPVVESKSPLSRCGFEFQRFGCSNFFETSTSEWESIFVDHFPFVTINNTGPLFNLESSLIHAIPEWRKVLNLRDRKTRSPRHSFRKGFKQFNAQPLKLNGTNVSSTWLSNDVTDLFAVDLTFCSFRVHFHDSACIVAIITIPTSKSSIVIYEDFFDILFSSEGLALSSSWCPQMLSDVLWGPSLPTLSPILNIRIRKGSNGSLGSVFELSFSVQHVSCTLSPEFLAILIGYFSLAYWKPKAKQLPAADISGYINTQTSTAISYKFEVLDSILFSPVGNTDYELLKLGIPQFYCTFIEGCSSDIIFRDIPVECLVPVDKTLDKNHCLNLFGRDLSLGMLFLKDDETDSYMFNQNCGKRISTLISPLSADVWIRIPCECEPYCARSSPPICIMAKVYDIQLIFDGRHVFVGYEALLGVINQFSSVDSDSQGFTSNVLQFLQWRRSLKESYELPVESPSVTLTEISCSVNSISIKFYTSRFESTTSKLVAEAQMQFLCYSSLRVDEPHCLDITFSFVSLYSLVNSVKLVECISSCLSSSIIEMKVSTVELGEFEMRVSLPFVDIFLHLFDWSEIIDLSSSYSTQKSKTSNSGLVDQSDNETVDVSSYCSQIPTMSNKVALENVKPDSFFFCLKSGNISITVHIPVKVTDEACGIFAEPQAHKDSYDVLQENNYGFLAVTLEGRCSELVSDGKTARLKCTVEKVKGTVEFCEEMNIQSQSFFQFLHMNLEAEICNNQVDNLKAKAEIRCDSLEVWLSYYIFYFWRCVLLEAPARGSSEFVVCRIDLTINLSKLSLLLIHGKLCSNGPLLEVLTRNLLLCAKFDESKIEASITTDLQVNYNNIHKVLWEPFLEPWMFSLTLDRQHKKNALLNSAVMTDIHLTSTSHLNLNLTESLFEVAFRAIDMIADALGVLQLTGLSRSPRYSNFHISDFYNGRYAPYVLQNMTSLPVAFHVCEGPVSSDGFELSALKDEIIVQPGSSVPIYIDETPEEQLLRYRPSHSSERLSDKQFMDTTHRYVSIQIEGISIPSAPISMDLVGLSCFEMNFSKSSKCFEVDNVGDEKTNVLGKNNAVVDSGYVVPVVVDVSVQRYTKLIRLYSTVLLLNATSTAFEVRFDIPFGVHSKMLDPLYPGQELPLPLHLAEAGCISWRPLGNAYLWSEACNISNILSHEAGIGFLRPVGCYPYHPSSDPFRFCISVHAIRIPASGRRKDGQFVYNANIVKQPGESPHPEARRVNESKKHFLHLVTLSSPLVVNNYLPLTITLTLESGGVTRTTLLSEVETSFFHIDSLHDLAMVFKIQGFGPSTLKFPRAETFCSMSKFSGTKFSVSESIAFDSELSGGPLYINVDKIMDAVSGARVVCISVPFLLYNCTGFPLIVSNCVTEMNGWGCTVPSCYNLEEDLFPVKDVGLGLLSSDQDFHIATYDDSRRNSSMNNNVVSIRKNVEFHPTKYLCNPLNLSASYSDLCGSPDKLELNVKETSASNLLNLSASSSRSNFKSRDYPEIDHSKVSGCMYSPDPNLSSSDIKVQVSRSLSQCHKENNKKTSWSSPFFLVPSTGSTSVLVPQLSKTAAYIVSVTSSSVAGPISGRTKIITFQPRYVISNACSKDLYFKQKGTDSVSRLRVGQHSHIHFADTTRELLVSVRFDEPAWQWSGCFLPEHLGDTQLKMRNYVSGAVTMIRVEVQNADVSSKDEKIVGSSNGNSGTNLILLSDDDTGFMPYRIDNFSKERLRIYQQRCEAFETIVHTYTSCPYAWDEPCFPHRLIVEVPGERVLGSYALDDVKEYSPVHLTATSEKHERTLFVYVQAEGVVKVLCIVDSTCHNLNDLENPHLTKSNPKRKQDQKKEISSHYNEKISFSISFIGISVMNSYPQELLYASAKNAHIVLVRSMDQETFSIQISSLQIDNQLRSSPYPVILSFELENRINPLGQVRNRDDNTKFLAESDRQITDSLFYPVFTLAAAKWRNTDSSLVSFEYISLKVADFHLEIEQEVILNLFDFYKIISSRFDSSIFPDTVSTVHLSSDFSLAEVSSYTKSREIVKANGEQLFFSTDNRNQCSLFPSVLPIGAPWQHIYLLARKQKKIYVELFDLAPISLTLSFSSSPWMLRNGVLTSGESIIHRGLMALADIEGAQIHLKQLVIAHQLASWESIQAILIRHYNRQFLHEMYKVFGSAGVIGNPMGFARSVGQGVKDFLSVPARSLVKNPAGLFRGMAQGTTSLLSNTVYAISDAATQFSRAAHKGIVAFTFDDQPVANMEKQQFGTSSHSTGVINGFLEGLTGLLQSPVKGAEKHGLPGVLSGIALGVTGVVARPAASILEVTGKTAQSIRNRSKLHMRQRFRVRLPRPLSRELPLRPYSWEEAVGSSVLAEAGDGLKLKDEILVLCKTLKQGGKFVIITERLVLIVSCSSLVDLGMPSFRGIPADPEWLIEAEIGMDTVIHASADMEVVHILGSNSDTLLKKNRRQHRSGETTGESGGNSSTPIPLFQTDVDFTCDEEAEIFLQVLLSTIKKGKERGWGAVYLLHQNNLK